MEGAVALIGGFLACIVLPWSLFAVGIWTIAKAARFRLGGRLVEAEVVEVRRNRMRTRAGQSSQPTYHPVFSYKAEDGRRRQVRTPFGTAHYDFETGTRMQIWVNPRHPEIARVPGIRTLVFGGVMALAGLAFGIFGMALFMTL